MKSFLCYCFVLWLAAGLDSADVSDTKSKKSVESSKPPDKTSETKPKRDASFLVGSGYHGPSFKYLPPSTSSNFYDTHHGLGSSFGSSGHISGHPHVHHGSHSYSGHGLGHPAGHHSTGHHVSHVGHSGLSDVKYLGIPHGSYLPSHSVSSSLGNHGFSGNGLGGQHHTHATGHGNGLSSGHVYELSSGNSHGISSGHGHGIASGHGHGISSGHGHGLLSGHDHGLSAGHGHGLTSGHGHGLTSGHGYGISSGHDIGPSSGHGHGLFFGHGHGPSSGHGHGISSGHGHVHSPGHGHGSIGPAYTAGQGLITSGSHSAHGGGAGLSHGGHSGHTYITSSSLGGSGLAHKPLTTHANVPSYNLAAGQVGTEAGLAAGYHYAKGISGSLPTSSHSNGATHLGSSGSVGDIANHGIASHGFANHAFVDSVGLSGNELHHSDHVHNGNQEHHYIAPEVHDDGPVGQAGSDDGYHYEPPTPVYLPPPTYQQPPHMQPSSSYGVPLATIGGSYVPIYHGQNLGNESPVYAAGHKGLGHFTYTPNKQSVLHTSFVDSEFKAPHYSNAPFKPSTFLGSKVEESSYAHEAHSPSLQYLAPSASGAETNGYDYPVPGHSFRDSEFQAATDTNATPIHEPESTYVPANNNLEQQSYNDISSNSANGEHSYGGTKH